MSATLEAVLEAPELVLWEGIIRARLGEERVRREQFYREITPSMKAEFINGGFVLHSPATVNHNSVRMRLAQLLNVHVLVRRLGRVFDEKLLVALTRNDYEPDIVFYGTEKAAGLQPDQLRCPVPDLVVEVLSPSTEENDRGVKFRDYAAHGIREYWLVDPEREVVEQYELIGQAYALRMKSGSGNLLSLVVQHFEISIRAVFDEQANVAELRRLAG